MKPFVPVISRLVTLFVLVVAVHYGEMDLVFPH